MLDPNPTTARHLRDLRAFLAELDAHRELLRIGTLRIWAKIQAPVHARWLKHGFHHQSRSAEQGVSAR